MRKINNKQKLWIKLQSLDRKISKLPKQMIWYGYGKGPVWMLDKTVKLFKKLDEERKKVRFELKSFTK